MKQIDLETWNRKEIYEHFSKVDHPFYSITIPIDVTNIVRVTKENNISFYHTMIWLCTKSLNEVPAFNQRIIDNKLYQLKQTNPSFTSMRPNEEIFQIITMKYNEDLNSFSQEATKLSLNQKTLFSSSDTHDLIFISCLPWFDFTSLINERNIDKDDLIPRLTWGKYYTEGDKILIHLSLDINHRNIDGIHIAKFKDSLDKNINKLQKTLV